MLFALPSADKEGPAGFAGFDKPEESIMGRTAL
jgi:hypothetical protein